MHILIIPSHEYPDEDSPLHGIFQQQQAHALLRAGVQVGVLATALQSPRTWVAKTNRTRQGFSLSDDNGIPVAKFRGIYWVPFSYRFQTWQSELTGAAIYSRYVERFGAPDLLHTHNALLGGVIAARIKRKHNVPMVITEHSSGYARKWIASALLPKAQAAFEAADARIVVSSALGRSLDATLGTVVRPWQVIPNLVDRRFSDSDAPASREAREDSTTRILSIGTLDTNKAHADLLRAFAQRFGNRTEACLRIGGSGPLDDELRRLAQEFHIADRVNFFGLLNRDAVLQEMQACDVYVHPSHFETFGVAIIEALACGKPVVVTRSGGPEEIVNAGNGLLVEPGDVSALGEALDSVLANREHYDAERIRADCVARFGEKAVTAKLIDVYHGVLSYKRVPVAVDVQNSGRTR